MEFTLAHGTGNDFVVLADPDDRLDVPVALVRALTDRRRGIGADGVIRIGSGSGDAQVFMDHRNADGSLAEMCGNGVRVVARYVVDHGLVTPSADGIVRVGTRAGTRAVRIVDRDAAGRVASVAVDMGPPSFDPATLPFATADPGASTHQLAVDGRSVELAVVSMGNPHAVVVVEDVAAAPVTAVGPALEVDERFPQGVNVGFAAPRSRQHLDLRVWERGVGETAACGTGACAAVTALQRLGLLDEAVDVDLPGGRLQIEHRTGGTVMMTGPAVEVAHGRLDDAWLATARAGSNG